MPEIYNSSAEAKEFLNPPDKIHIFVFRHGQTDALEYNHWAETDGLWDPAMDDLTEEGKEKVSSSADAVKKLVDPEKQIAVLLSSPRARTMTSSSIVADTLKETGIEFFHSGGQYAPVQMTQFLRSRGDFSYKYNPQTGKDTIDDIHMRSVPRQVYEQRERDNTGWRMLEFLNYCATFFPNYYSEKPPIDPYKGKEPVLFLFTHNEVVADFLEKLELVDDYDKEQGALPKGDFFELVCDLKNPGHFTVLFPDPAYQHESAEIYIDFEKTGWARSSKGGELRFEKGLKETVEDKTARGNIDYI